MEKFLLNPKINIIIDILLILIIWCLLIQSCNK